MLRVGLHLWLRHVRLSLPPHRGAPPSREEDLHIDDDQLSLRDRDVTDVPDSLGL